MQGAAGKSTLLAGLRARAVAGLPAARSLGTRAAQRMLCGRMRGQLEAAANPPPAAARLGGAVGHTRAAGQPLGQALRARSAAVCRAMSSGLGDVGEGKLPAMCEDYVAKSNAGDVEACICMFDKEAVYGSSTVGGHVGVDAIGTMMRGFFAKCPNVHWEVEPGGYKMADETTVEFDFVRTGVPNAEGRDTRQRGTERVRYTRDSSSGEFRIAQVSVEVHDTQAL